MGLWLKSIQAMIFPTLKGVSNMPPGILRDRREMTMKSSCGGLSEERLYNRDYLIAVFNRHNEDVQSAILGGRLLTYDVSEGWGCSVNFWM